MNRLVTMRRLVLFGLFAASSPAWGASKPAHKVYPESTPTFKVLKQIVGKINPGWLTKREKFGNNCVKTSLALDATLAGNPAVALPGPGDELGGDRRELSAEVRTFNPSWKRRDYARLHPVNAKLFGIAYPGKKFTTADSLVSIGRRLKKLGPGSRAIVFMKASAKSGHVVNMVNFGGDAFLLDGQSGTIHHPREEDVWPKGYDYILTAHAGPSLLDTAEGRRKLLSAFAKNKRPRAPIGGRKNPHFEVDRGGL